MILSDFFERPQDLDNFLIELPEGSFTRIVDGKIVVTVDATIVAVNNRFYEIKPGKVVKIVTSLTPLTQERPKRKRH